jgi:hypothetical protein
LYVLYTPFAMYRGVAAAGLPLAKHLESLLQPAVDAAVQDVRTQMPSACSAASGNVSDVDDPYSSDDDTTATSTAATTVTATATATVNTAAGATATATNAVSCSTSAAATTNGSVDSMHVDTAVGANGLTNGHTAAVDTLVVGAQQEQQQAAAALKQKQRKRRANMRTSDAWLLADSVHRYARGTNVTITELD